MAAVLGIISRRGLRIRVHHRNQPIKISWYCIRTVPMAQNFYTGKFWQIMVGKFLTNKKLTNANVFILSSS